MSEISSQTCLAHTQGQPFWIQHGHNTGNIFVSRRQDKDPVDDEVLAVETSDTLLRFSGLNFYWVYKGVHKHKLA